MAKPPSGEGTRHEAGRAASAGPAPLAHSLVEERLYLLTVRCSCGGGPLEKLSQTLALEGERQIDIVRTRCPRCSAERDYRFDVTTFIGRFYPRRGVSDTSEPSQLLDAVAWARWARTYLRAFEGERTGLEGDDRIDCGILALRCLDEALKQFARGEPVLLEGDLHTQGSREAFRAGPERYGRYELMGLKLQIAMVLTSGGVDPDARDPGVVGGGLMRLSGALARTSERAEDAGATVATIKPSALGAHAGPTPLALPAPKGVRALLPAPRESDAATLRQPWFYDARLALMAACAALLLGAALIWFGSRG